MKDLFSEKQAILLKLANNSHFRQALEIANVPSDKKILKVFPNGVVYENGKSFKWLFWGRDVIADALYANMGDVYQFSKLKPPNTFEYLNRYRFAWITNTFNSNSGGDATLGAVDGSSWANARNAVTANDTVDNTSTTDRCDNSLSGSNRFIYRPFLPFDTSALTDGVSITSATMDLYVDAVVTAGHNAALVVSTQASFTTIVANDYDNLGSTEFTNSRFDFTSTGQKSQALNASGLANISTTGYSGFVVRGANDLDNSQPAGIQGPSIRSVRHATANTRPLLTVVTPAVGSGSILHSFA